MVGVISDTHGLLRDEALEALAGSDVIVHAGDVGDAAILRRLARTAPVHAVRGNVDHGELGRSLPFTEVVDLAVPGAPTPGPLIYVIHRLEDLDLDPSAAGISVVVYGHSHQPDIRWSRDVLYFNPGAAGPRRFRLPVTVGRLVFGEGEEISAEIVHLEGRDT